MMRAWNDNGDEFNCFRRCKVFVPSDVSKGYTTVVTYEATWNEQGYYLNEVVKLQDGTEDILENGYTVSYNDDGAVVSYEELTQEGELIVRGNISYDDYGNVVKIELENEDGKYIVDIEYMLVPEYLMEQYNIIHTYKFALISELIENVIPRIISVTAIDELYTKEMLLKFK